MHLIQNDPSFNSIFWCYKKEIGGTSMCVPTTKATLDNKLSDIMSKVAVISRLGNWGVVGYRRHLFHFSTFVCFYFLLTHSKKKKQLPHVHLSSFITNVLIISFPRPYYSLNLYPFEHIVKGGTAPAHVCWIIN